MIPSTVLGVVLAVASLSPGYVYIRAAAQKRPRAEKSTLLETGEFLLAGTAASAGASLLVFALGAFGLPLAVDLSSWVNQGSQYLVDHPWRVVASAVTAFALALALARVAAWLVYRSEDSDVSDLPVWWNVFGDRPKQHEVFVSVTTRSGRILEGFLFAHSTPGDTEPRDLALKPPLWLWQAGDRYRVDLVDRVVIPAAEIVEVDVRYVPPASS